MHYDQLMKELGRPGKTYEVTCAECGDKKYPYRTKPPEDPFVCALCLLTPLKEAVAAARRRGRKQLAKARRKKKP